MAFLDWPQDVDRRAVPSDTRRQRMAAHLISLFAEAFPQIAYELVWSSKLINAQAWRIGKSRNVYIYGGIVRHPLIKRAGLALTIAHETGHHLGGPPYDPFMPGISWQGQADYWAANVGMPKVFGGDATALTLRGAREIAALQREFAELLGEEVAEFSPRRRTALFRAGINSKGLPAFARNALKKELEYDY